MVSTLYSTSRLANATVAPCDEEAKKALNEQKASLEVTKKSLTAINTGWEFLLALLVNIYLLLFQSIHFMKLNFSG